MPIPLAIVWHQHQPFYKDLATGDMVLPWVRLHGVKDYYGMARLLKEFPGMRCTINLVPSMLVQLQDYVEKKASDPFLRRSEIAADALSTEDRSFILDHFFMAQWDRMIRIYPRYAQLLELRKPGKRPAQSALADFSVNDLRDLQVWFNLAWFHPVSFEESPALRELLKKGRDFNEADKAQVLREQHAVLCKVIPLHKELCAKGQLELTTTPFYHPILPLLCDMKSCQAAMPKNPLPAGHQSLTEDAEMQIKKAVIYHQQLFGSAPQGMWPSEGSVSMDIIPLLARHGIRWIATDEEILSATLGAKIRGNFGKLDRPDLLYQPWLIELGGAKVHAIFRDHHLSDLIGFQYQGWDGAAAADDFLLRVQSSAPASGSHLVSVILDGENCWEHYPDQGLRFLRTLYAKLEHGQHNVSSTRVSDYLNQHPSHQKLDRIFPGSWINHDFYIWVGHAEDRHAWEYVYRVRQDLCAVTQARKATAADDPALAQAWEELYIAEGSDWYWWYGDDHSSGNDEAFDTLFRTHLKNVYKFIGQSAPQFLNVPVKGGGLVGRFTRPTSTLSVTVDGRSTNYFEWLGSGRYRADKEGGVMTAAGQSLLDQIFFGYERKNLCVRLDLHEQAPDSGSAKAQHPISKVRFHFGDWRGLSLELAANDGRKPVFTGPWVESLKPQVESAWQDVLELRVPFAAMGLKESEELSFYVEVAGQGRAAERFPRSCALQFTVPPENIHEIDWMA